MKEKVFSNNYSSVGKPIGGWLILFPLFLVSIGLSSLLYLFTIINGLTTSGDFYQYFQTKDDLFSLRVNIHLCISLLLIGSLCFTIIALSKFFKKQQSFINTMIGLIGYLFLTEAATLFMLEYYSDMSGIELPSMEGDLFRIGIIGAILGLYLKKGKRPIQTFVN